MDPGFPAAVPIAGTTEWAVHETPRQADFKRDWAPTVNINWKMDYHEQRANEEWKKLTEGVSSVGMSLGGRSSFVDPSFPPVEENLAHGLEAAIVRPNEAIPQGLAWRRPVHVQGRRLGDSQYWRVFGDKIDPSNINQGALGDCWFLASLSVLAERPELVKLLFLNGVDITEKPAGTKCRNDHDMELAGKDSPRKNARCDVCGGPVLPKPKSKKGTSKASDVLKTVAREALKAGIQAGVEDVVGDAKDGKEEGKDSEVGEEGKKSEVIGEAVADVVVAAATEESDKDKEAQWFQCEPCDYDICMPCATAKESIGAFQVRICCEGTWQTVVVDDWFPCYHNSFAFVDTKTRELWPIILEKAYAKVYGGYGALAGGRPGIALQDLTGFPAERMQLLRENEWSLNLTDASLEKQTVGRPREAMDVVWSKLKEFRRKGYLLALSTLADTLQADTTLYGAMGLAPSHAYAILDVREVSAADGEVHRLVKCRNPWGIFEWQGAWSDRSAHWTPQLREELAFHSVADDGVFWMPFADVCDFFNEVAVCRILPDWFDKRFQDAFPPRKKPEGEAKKEGEGGEKEQKEKGDGSEKGGDKKDGKGAEEQRAAANETKKDGNQAAAGDAKETESGTKCLNGHPMPLLTYREGEYRHGWKCDQCSEDFSSATPRYFCKECGEDLCMQCNGATSVRTVSRGGLAVRFARPEGEEGSKREILHFAPCGYEVRMPAATAERTEMQVYCRVTQPRRALLAEEHAQLCMYVLRGGKNGPEVLSEARLPQPWLGYDLFCELSVPLPGPGEVELDMRTPVPTRQPELSEGCLFVVVGCRGSLPEVSEFVFTWSADISVYIRQVEMEVGSPLLTTVAEVVKGSAALKALEPTLAQKALIRLPFFLTTVFDYLVSSGTATMLTYPLRTYALARSRGLAPILRPAAWLRYAAYAYGLGTRPEELPASLEGMWDGVGAMLCYSVVSRLPLPLSVWSSFVPASGVPLSMFGFGSLPFFLLHRWYRAGIIETLEPRGYAPLTTPAARIIGGLWRGAMAELISMPIYPALVLAFRIQMLRGQNLSVGGTIDMVLQQTVMAEGWKGLWAGIFGYMAANLAYTAIDTTVHELFLVGVRRYRTLPRNQRTILKRAVQTGAACALAGGVYLRFVRRPNL